MSNEPMFIDGLPVVPSDDMNKRESLGNITLRPYSDLGKGWVKVRSSAFPDKEFVLNIDGKLVPTEPFKPGDRAQLALGQWHILQSDGNTWILEDDGTRR